MPTVNLPEFISTIANKNQVNPVAEQQGSATASLLLRKLSNYPCQNGLALAQREIGLIERTLTHTFCFGLVRKCGGFTAACYGWFMQR